MERGAKWEESLAKKDLFFYSKSTKSPLGGAPAVELGVAVCRRVDVSLYACRKRCPRAEARETRGWRGRRVERITNMTSILRQAWGRSNHRRLGSTIPPRPLPVPPLPATLAPHAHVRVDVCTHPRTLNFDFIRGTRERLQPGGTRVYYVTRAQHPLTGASILAAPRGIRRESEQKIGGFIALSRQR